MGLFCGLMETVQVDTVKLLTPVNLVWVLKAVTVRFCLPVGDWSNRDKQYSGTCLEWT